MSGRTAIMAARTWCWRSQERKTPSSWHGGCARPNATVMVVAFYDEPQTIPLPEMYGKNLIFKTGGVDGCDCAEILRLIEQGKLDTTPLITHRFPLSEIEEAYRIFENRLDGVIKVAITADKPQKFGRQ